VFGAVRIVDATSGATLAQFNIQADDAEMAARTNRDPAAALAANLLVAAVSPETDLQQNSLAGAFQAKVREALGGSTLF